MSRILICLAIVILLFSCKTESYFFDNGYALDQKDLRHIYNMMLYDLYYSNFVAKTQPINPMCIDSAAGEFTTIYFFFDEAEKKIYIDPDTFNVEELYIDMDTYNLKKENAKKVLIRIKPFTRADMRALSLPLKKKLVPRRINTVDELLNALTFRSDPINIMCYCSGLLKGNDGNLYIRMELFRQFESKPTFFEYVLYYKISKCSATGIPCISKYHEFMNYLMPVNTTGLNCDQKTIVGGY